MKRFYILACLSGAITAALILAEPAVASRNSVGSMQSVNGPYISGTTISSTAVNARFADIETEITNSLDRGGRGGMTAALRGTDGFFSAPAYSFTSDTGSGLYRIGAGDLGLSIGGSKREEWTGTTTTMTNNLVESGTLGVTGAATLSSTLGVTGVSTLTGNVGIGGAPTYALDVFGSNALGRFGGTGFSLNQSITSAFGAYAYNLYWSGAAWTYNSTNPGILLHSDNSGNFSVYTAPSGSAGAGAAVTQQIKVNSGGLTVGATGTAISASFRGTVSWTPSALGLDVCQQNAITVTGAVLGADCAYGTPGGSNVGVSYRCEVTANTCTLTACAYGGAATPPSGTYSCRVFNP